ncbi:preprotein translocase subunit YajC [Pyrinomonas methylaliphatogenes]|jgi:preprotein translocase subunit YajC|uniref:Sec translocon accessory complex subunit YajC n=1 Tax=Pyrinomonas methylaliphatogenes TaxID=454194 RepID=A0A0B6WYE1_9BACT|nr:preprotein translocase subunit YajC [Pyrinomonas methylaliphatogenes]MBX5479515.1 preprotein translocase subunit YajC [Pyrinomonas methylaliphatogenes]CDM66288.1 preprotein translocase, YajC subunit [Pyrinomonas methylaliphatogenes]
MSSYLALFLQQGQQPGLGGFLISLLPFFIILGIFYVLIILPQRRRYRELQQLIANLKVGDRIVTTGGIIGTVTAVRDKTLLVRTAEKSILEISRSAVAGLHNDEERARS